MRLLPTLGKPKLSLKEKFNFIEGLSIMLSAGIPILEALDSLHEDTSDKGSNLVIKKLSDSINSGKSLSEAMESYPDSFDPVLINIVKSGEESGKLEEVLAQTAKNLKEQISTNDAIKSALFYPALVLAALFAVAFYMFSFSLPTIAKEFKDLNFTLPAYSSLIMDFSLLMEKYRLFVLAGFIAFILLVYRIFSITRIKRIAFSLLANTPTINTLIRYMDLSRFTNTSSLLLNAGLPIIETLEVSKKVVFSGKLSSDIEFLKESITQGTNLSEAMKKRPKSFPSLLRRVIGVGEQSGNLEKSFANISNLYQQKFTDIVKNISVLIEPVLLLVIGLLVGVVLLSVVAPIYQLIGQLNP